MATHSQSGIMGHHMVRILKERGVVFIDHGAVQPSEKGALTQVYLGDVTFELVVSHLRPGATA